MSTRQCMKRPFAVEPRAIGALARFSQVSYPKRAFGAQAVREKTRAAEMTTLLSAAAPWAGWLPRPTAAGKPRRQCRSCLG